MKKNSFLLLIIVLILISAVFLRIRQWQESRHLTKIAPVEIVQTEEEVSNEKQGKEEERDGELNLLIINPINGELVSSPLLVQGKISLNWLIDETLQLAIADEEENIIIQGLAIVNNDQELDDLTSFTGLLEFSLEELELESGFLVISRDEFFTNTIRLPIKFK